MDLTSDGFIWAIRILLVLSVIWIVVRWPAAAKPGVLAISRRLGALLVVAVLAVLNVLGPINAQYGWYTSWSDLWGSLTEPEQVVPAGHAVGQSAARTTALPGGPSPLRGLPTTARAQTSVHPTPLDSGGYQEFTVPGPVSGYTGTITVWFPASYTDPANQSREYPVVEAFHGYLPNPLGYFRVFHLDTRIAQLVADRRLREPLVVIPWWAPNRLDTECVDGGPGRLRMETWLTQDVPRWVYQHLRVAPTRQSWATFGASAGGWCSLMATTLHPGTYAAAISLGGYAQPDFDPSYVPFGPATPLGRRYDLAQQARRTPPPVALWTMTSAPDHLSYHPTMALVHAARPPLSVTPTVVAQGSHRTQVWDPYVVPGLEWLGRVSAGFRPLP